MGYSDTSLAAERPTSTIVQRQKGTSQQGCGARVVVKRSPALGEGQPACFGYSIVNSGIHATKRMGFQATQCGFHATKCMEGSVINHGAMPLSVWIPIHDVYGVGSQPWSHPVDAQH